MVCEKCTETCEGCDFGEKILVPECITLSDAGLEHAWSGGAVTTIEGLKIDEGYWRATANSMEVLECYNGDACSGGVTGATDYCSEGYKGACEEAL